HHLYDHAHESPAVMTLPLVVLAAFSVGVAWGWPLWETGQSYLGNLLQAGEPHSRFVEEGRHAAHDAEVWALAAGLIGAALGAGLAYARHRSGRLGAGAPTPVRQFLLNRLYFDELDDRHFTRPAVALSAARGALDQRPTD